jgi:hypothetical protein
VILFRNGATSEVIEYAVNLSESRDDDSPMVVDWYLSILVQILNNPGVQALKGRFWNYKIWM